MSVILITYSDETCTISKQVCCEAALANGVDICWPQNPDTVSQEFKTFNREVWGQERGSGYWIWKPYVIYKAILQCEDNSYLIYCDAGVKIIENVNHIINVMDQDVFLFSNGHNHVHWCKKDVINAINGADLQIASDYRQYEAKQQVQASVIFFRVNDFTRAFCKEWLMWCQMPGFIDDSPSKLPNHPEFAQHRYDQAILTCISIKYGLKLHWWADKMWYESQRYRWPEDKYPSMFLHHRRRNPGTVTNPEGPTW